MFNYICVNISFNWFTAVFNTCQYETNISAVINCDSLPNSEDPNICQPDPFKRTYTLNKLIIAIDVHVIESPGKYHQYVSML